MPRPKHHLELQKTALNLYKEDWVFLLQAYDRMGAGAAIRELVHAHVQKIRAEIAKKTQATVEIPMEEIFPE